MSNGLVMPTIGLGTYPMKGKELSDAVCHAYRAGYRLFDTADNYYNEEDLGMALENLYDSTGATRKDVFIVSKVSDELYEPGTLGGGSNMGKYFWKNSPEMQGKDAVRRVVRMRLEDSLSKLKTDYLDLWLMHWPYPDFFEEIWTEMEEVYREGKVKAIGVCNCRIRHFERLKKVASVFPMVNQYETSPLNTKEADTEYCNRNNIKVMIYSPLKNLNFKVKEYRDVLDGLSAKYGKSNSQILLRFDVQRGMIPIPKSANPNRLKSNIDIFDFSLTAEEMDVLMSCNRNLMYMPESRSCPGL